tara:strand:+ start:4514 stop:5179 length:666 start_codon:yes stop_codon:yes gene_type:complete
MEINVIITGTTGMVGKAVLLECLDDPAVNSILVINRKSIGIKHSKLKEIIHTDFFHLAPIQQELKGYNACFFCLGVSVVGLNEDKYHKLTYDLTVHFAETIAKENTEMIFNYVSGAGTDTSEQGKVMWARVKGKTENKLISLFKDVYLFRPGAILPEKGVKSNVVWYNAVYVVLRPFYPLLKKMNSITTSRRVGRAMINSVLKGSENKHLENQDINLLAKA